MRTNEYRIQRGPFAGQTVSAEAYRLPSGDWEVILYATPWNDRISCCLSHTRWQFPGCNPAYEMVRHMEASMKEMSKGSYVV